jgi:hypothetical protein
VEEAVEDVFVKMMKRWDVQHRAAYIDKVGNCVTAHFGNTIAVSPPDIPGAKVNAKYFKARWWWHNHRLDYPHLYDVAMDTFVLPASSASVERQSSRAKLVMTTHRGGSVLPETEQKLFWMACGRELVIETVGSQVGV